MSGNRWVTELEKTYVGDNAVVNDVFLLDKEASNTHPDISGADGRTLLTTSDSAPAFPGESVCEDRTTVGKYQIKEVLGQGGMGVVYRAFDPLIEREVALKVLAPQIAGSADALQRFLGEARSIGRLNHPNIVAIYEINEWHGLYYLVMELLTGGSVADLSERRGALPWREACRIVAQAARGLAAAHAAGMVHRDVKPANLMLTQSGDVKVVDFGLSKIHDAANNSLEAVTRAGQVLGTPQYMSPEQFEGVGVDFRTDIYALGGSLFRLLTDRFPYHECESAVQLMKAHVMKPVPVASRTNFRVPTACDRIIRRAMAKDPLARYKSCDEMAAELEMLFASNAATSVSIPRVVSEQISRDEQRHDRVLSSAIVIEPSKLQAAIRKDVLTQAGAKTVAIANSIAEAQALLESQKPDIFWTAMELADGRGIDWLRSLGRHGVLQNSTVVLNCSDGKMSDLLSVGKAGSLILAPRAARLESILKVMQVAGPVRFSDSAMSSDFDPSLTPIRVISNTGRVPERLAALLNELELTDVEINLLSATAAKRIAAPRLTLLIRDADRMSGDEEAYCAMVAIRRAELAASVQVVADRLILRAVGYDGVTATVHRPMNAAVFRSLLQVGN